MKDFLNKNLLICFFVLVLGVFLGATVLAVQAVKIDEVVVGQDKIIISSEETACLHKQYLEWSDIFLKAQEDKNRLKSSSVYSDATKDEIKQILDIKQEYAIAQLNSLRQQGYVPEDSNSFPWLVAGLVGSGVVLCSAIIIAYILLRKPAA
ncbi:MAG: hypothetical protein ABH827_02685 [bacterium]